MCIGTHRDKTRHKSAAFIICVHLAVLSISHPLFWFLFPHPPCLLLQSSLPPYLTSLSCTLPHACFPCFSLPIHASGSLLIILDLLKYIHRFTLLFYASCFLPLSQMFSLPSSFSLSSISSSFSLLAFTHAS